jgi:hypothetical protein
MLEEEGRLLAERRRMDAQNDAEMAEWKKREKQRIIAELVRTLFCFPIPFSFRFAWGG